MNPILETRRLVVRAMSFADLDFIAAILADPEVMRFYPRCYSRDEAGAWVQRQLDRYARHEHGFWLVLDPATSQPVGQVGLIQHQVEGVEESEIGYLIHRPFWRRGFATEAAGATRDYAFDVLGKPRVICLVRPENIPSQGVARKIGLEPEPRTVEHGGFAHRVFSMARAGRGERIGWTVRRSQT